jgi:hypothetical protein
MAQLFTTVYSPFDGSDSLLRWIKRSHIHKPYLSLSFLSLDPPSPTPRASPSPRSLPLRPHAPVPTETRDMAASEVAGGRWPRFSCPSAPRLSSMLWWLRPQPGPDPHVRPFVQEQQSGYGAGRGTTARIRRRGGRGCADPEAWRPGPCNPEAHLPRQRQQPCAMAGGAVRPRGAILFFGGINFPLLHPCEFRTPALLLLPPNS